MHAECNTCQSTPTMSAIRGKGVGVGKASGVGKGNGGAKGNGVGKSSGAAGARGVSRGGAGGRHSARAQASPSDEECARGPSAGHSGRPSAWCKGADGGFSAAAAAVTSAVAVSASSLCMLSPVHPPHFGLLAQRVELTYKLVDDAPPTLVAVYDDAAGAAQFCRRHATACKYPHFHQLNLQELVGPDAWPAAQGMLRTGGWREREKLRDRLWPGDPLARECAAKFSGQCYQTLKKFYGAAAGPAHCTHYWVTDAESFPFRRYNFSEVARHSFEADGRLFRHLLSWYPSRWGCPHTQNLYSDASCGEWVANTLRMTQYPEAGFDAQTALSSGGAATVEARAAESVADVATRLNFSLGAKMRQTMFDLNNWWWYDRRMVRAMIDRVEQVRDGQHFVRYFASLQTTDVAFWDYNFEHLVTLPSAPMAARSFLADIETHLPAAFAACCACRGDPSRRPCYTIDDLWGECFRRHASLRRIGRFIVERLGIFGLFGNLMAEAPRAVLAELLAAEPRLSWAISNAHKWRPPPQYSPTKLLGKAA